MAGLVLSMPRKDKPGVFVWEGMTKQGFLANLSKFVEEVGESLEVTQKTLWDIQMAVEEAAANSYEHSYGGKKGKLRLEIGKDKGEIKITMTDWGASSPNVDEVPEPHIVPELKHVDLEGLGMMMIRRSMDEVEFSSTSDGNAVTMRKRIS